MLPDIVKVTVVRMVVIGFASVDSLARSRNAARSEMREGVGLDARRSCADRP